jgi:integrase
MDTLAARSKLKPSGKPYFRALSPGLHLGYRKGQRAAKWVIRIDAETGYTVETFADADAFIDGKWREITSYAHAQAAATELARKRRAPVSSNVGHVPFTVNIALDHYIERLEAEHSKSLVDARSRIDRLIRPALGDKLVTALERKTLSGWLAKLAAKPRHVRGRGGEAARPLADAETEDEKRKRKASANRTFTYLRAALNQAFREGHADTDAAWRAVKPFREVEAARVTYLTIDEAQRLANSAQGDFRTLVNAALFSGCRYGELARLHVGDFNTDAGTLFVAKSKSGKARHVVLTEEGQRFFRQIALGRDANALLLEKDSGGAWGSSHQVRPMKDACVGARIKPASFHILRHTYASLLAMAGVPLNVIARNLGHADTRMCERHYAHLAPSYVAETIRKFAPELGTVEQSNVIDAKRARGE